MVRSLVSLAALLCALGACAQTTPAAPVPAAVLGDPALGFSYAEQNCASCHAIARDAALSPRVAAPPFEQIANTPGMTRTALAAWLQSPHPSMPLLIVEPERVDDLAAYIATLRR